MVTWLIDNLVLVRDEKTRPIWYLWAGSSLVCMWLFFWWAIGAWPLEAFGQGFARAEDVQGIKVQLLETDVLRARIAQCEAPTSEVRQFYATRLQRLQREYQALTKNDFPLPTCAEIVGPRTPPQ